MNGLEKAIRLWTDCFFFVWFYVKIGVQRKFVDKKTGVDFLQKRFIIIDGSSLLHRAFYALPLLTTASGQYTNAIYGFTTMLTKLIGEWQPDLLVIAFDKAKKTFRNELFVDYKAKRQKTPIELSAQMPLIRELAEAFGIAFIEREGYEADDIIGTLATKAAAKGHEAIVVTGDKDALQLIGPNLKVLLTKKGISEMQVFDEAAFKAAYGLEPIDLIDLKGLMGDSSDNIPGVPGVGEKTATKLLLEYGSVENVLENIEAVSGKKLKENLTNNKELALLSKKLATIIRDMPLDFLEAEYVISPQKLKLQEFCQRCEFKNIFPKIEQLFPETDGLGFGAVVEQLMPDYRILADSEEVAAVAAAVKKEQKLVFCCLSRGRVPQQQLDGMAISLKDELVFLPGHLCSDAIISLFADPAIAKSTHDLKPLYHMLPQIEGALFDTMLAAYLLEPAASEYQLEDLIGKYLEIYEQVPDFSDVPEQALWRADCVRRLEEKLQSQLVEQGLMQLYIDVELPLLSVLAEMEQVGIYVNQAHLEKMATEISGYIAVLLNEIYVLAGKEFNVNSPKQLGEILFDRLELPAVKKTKTGYSTNAEVLDELHDQHPIIPKVLEYRLWTKLKSTYLDGMEVLIAPETSRIHTTFNQMVTATGRLSSSEPNLQNIPVRTAEGRKIRELFEPGPGYDYLLSADYSQIELRVLAHMSEDKSFLEAFNENQDIHARTAAEVFDVPMDLVTPELRRKAKAVNFGIVYGISDYGLSRDLHIPRKEAAQYIESYFAKCAGVKRFIDQVVEAAHKDGFVTTIFGRKRYLPAINSSNYNQRTLAERMAMNTPIQGTAADIIKMAMIEVQRELRRQQLKSRLLLQVHDELVLEVVGNEVDAVSALLQNAMQNVVKLAVPLTIDINLGKNWAQAK